tara:strand:+ start:12611 stop:13486 length:876 start_codon:yes stop_codon:yes gene_type:complete
LRKFCLSIAFSSPEDYITLARAAESNGFSAVSVADHLIFPKSFSVPYPYTEDGVPRFGDEDDFPDPWIAITAMAGVTRTLEFLTNVFVLPARNPVQVAKILSTASIYSHGRIGLGIGMGWMPEEFEAAGQDFARRGKRADEMLHIMQALWTGEYVRFQGEHYTLAPMRMLPRPYADIPIYVGGFSSPALKRAARHDGWIADLHSLAELEELVGALEKCRVAEGTQSQPFRRFAFGCTDAVGASGYRSMFDMGIDTVTLMPWLSYCGEINPPVVAKVDAIARFADEVIADLR